MRKCIPAAILCFAAAAWADDADSFLDTTRISVRFEGTPIREVVKSLRDRYGLRIYLDESVPGDTAVYAERHDMALRSFLDIHLWNRRIGYTISGTTIRLVPKEKARRGQLEKALYTHRADLNVENASILDVVKGIEAMGVHISIAPTISRDTRLTLNLKNAPPETVLRKMCRLNNDLTYRIREDGIWIIKNETGVQGRAEKELDSTLDDLRVDLDYQSTPIFDVADHLCSLANKNIRLDPTIEEDTSFTIQVKDVTLRSALESLCSLGGSLTYRIQREDIWITPMNAKERETARVKGALEEALDTKRVDADFQGAPIKDVVDSIRTLVNLGVALDPSVPGETKVTRRLQNVSLRQAFERICDPESGLTFEIRDHACRIRKRSTTQHEASERQLELALDQKTVTRDLKDTPIHLATNTLREDSRLNLVLDKRIPEDTVINADFRNVSLRAALDRICAQNDDLTYIIRHEAIWIMTRDTLYAKHLRQK